MSTREVLVERADVANRDIDDIIEIAAELQDVEREAAEGASVDDGSSAALTRLASDLRDADEVPTKLKASDALGAAMATQLGHLPPPTGPAAAQSRADLQHEVSGITNRITVERRRYEEARLTYDQANRGLGASPARGIGLH